MTWHWRLFICRAGDAPSPPSPRLSSFDLSFIATFRIIQPRILLCSHVYSCLCSKAYTRKNAVPSLWTAVVRYSAECNPLHHSTKYLYIYLPSRCHFGLQNPWREKCIKPLAVFTCVGWMLMCEGRPEDGGWEIDHRWMSVRGILTSTTAFHALSSENPSSRDLAPSENTTTYHTY